MMRPFTTILPAGLALVGALVLIECNEPKSGATAPDRPQANALFGGRAIENVPAGELASYERSLHFETSAPEADAATIRTADGGTITIGAAPAVDASRMTDQDRVGGRIIARIESSAAYAPLGLAAGVTYFWVEGAGDRARAVLLSADGSSRVTRPLILRQHAFGNVTQPTVRFISAPGVNPAIPLVNGRCGAECCSFSVPGLRPEDMPLIDAALLEMHQRIATSGMR